ncbi:MAG TPA: glycosyltransferase family 39 protein [Trebonia sp.]|nr:glycosyltransferase family 39 protein [Trebonia sp.]
MGITVAASAPARGLARGQARDPRWARPLLAGLLAATAVAYLWGLSRNQWGNDFYAAAVQAGTRSWKAFFFGSFDSASFITVDKTPASLWVMEISARIFGFTSWSLLVPQALEGVLSVAVLYATVKRWFGPLAGLLAGVVLAITPVATLMFRFDNPDALLVLLLTCAAWAVTRALERESGAARWLLLAGVVLGLAFLAKMLAAFLVVPGLAAAYLWAAPSRLRRRLAHLLWAGLGIAAGGGWWVIAAQLTPASARPYFGGSTDNSIVQLAIGYNGLGRLDGTERGGRSGAAGRAAAGHGLPAGRLADQAGLPVAHGHGGFGGSTGITRLFGPQFGGQVGWLLPAALLALLALAWLSRRAPRTDRMRAFALLWGGWLVVSGLTFSYMQGIIHPYYTLALTPAIGALVGVGGARLLPAAVTGGAPGPREPAATPRGHGLPASAGRLLAALTVAVTGWWGFELLARSPSWLPWLRWVVAGAAAGAVVAILAAGRGRRAVGLAALGLTAVAALAGPLAYSVKTIATTHSGGMPTAGPTVAGAFRGLGGPGLARPGRPSGGRAGGLGGLGAFGGLGGGNRVSGALLALVTADASRYRWIAATDGSMQAAPIELASGGDAVMAIGGFSGSDPAPTLRQFQAMVAARQVHYYIQRGTGGRRAGGGAGGQAAFGGFPGLGGPRGDAGAIASWVAARFTAQAVGGATVYDLTRRRA